jgi:hypothetical protein
MKEWALLDQKDTTGMKNKLVFGRLSTLLLAVGLLGGGHGALANDGNNRGTKLSDSRAKLDAVLSTATKPSTELLSVRKIEDLHYIVEYLDESADCRAKGYFVAQDPTSDNVIAYRATSDQLRRVCETEPK